MSHRKKTKIVSTIGPASENDDTLRQMFSKGVNVCRLNFSHGTHEEHRGRMETIKRVRNEMKLPVAIMLDTKGPEIRVGKFKNGKVLLAQGQKFTLTTKDILGDESICSVSYNEISKDVSVGDTVLIDDGLVSLIVEEKSQYELLCTVQNGGEVSDRKGVNIPGARINLPAVTQKDREDIIFGIENGIDFVAASFIRKAEDVLDIRRVLEENGGNDISVISKIENAEGVENADEILQVSDGLMVARGDLGVEILPEEVPLVQKELIRKCNRVGKPVITATQMLDSMIRNPRPTRAEVADVANAIFDGTDAIMLSGETAIGSYPVDAVSTMSKIALRIEASPEYIALMEKEEGKREENTTVTNAVSHATCTSARELGASAIITVTASGLTASMVSRFKPVAPIIAVTSFEKVTRKLSLVWGVESVLSKEFESTDKLVEDAIACALDEKHINAGDLVVITAGVPVGGVGGTNIMKVHIVAEIITRGVGIGKESIEGKACVVPHGQDVSNSFKKGCILVARTTDIDYNRYIQDSLAVIIEEGGLTSHAALVALHMGKPVIVGAKDATKLIKSGDTITLDTSKGVVYMGSASVL
ncbi:pyruvate kinase [Peptoclostridium litorale DSM 5388]|uniref:Pyruvate kinase n=1 Tax=Peptoclostridium litorale DSM 5388 TaxID=1121324 RepID=A0A069RCY0_PEPLI|nr:pyruvate kinase [Peptoclostridium litorale]KDR94886.1 pyruvate kinase Pyk [Peptoclostridium litorale DSM 5388]SIN94901.1 pyruvate kinase [Peptoclostridium litorale DSM 5388]